MSTPVQQPDLSGDDVTPELSDGFHAALRMKEQQFSQRKWLFGGILCWATVMSLCFIGFVVWSLAWQWRNPAQKLDWHFLLLGSGLILPVVVVVWHLMKQVYRAEHPPAEESSGILWADVIKEAIAALKDAFGSK